MNVNYPHREPLVVRNHELRVIRRFSGDPEIRVRAGERLSPERIIARTDPADGAVHVPIADQLGIAPQDVAKSLMRPIGSSFAAGEVLARTRKGLRSVVVTAPVAGVLLLLDEATGTALLAPGNGGEIPALIPGDVEFVDGRQAISIRTVGARLLGIVGLGEPVRGPLRVLANKPDEELQASQVTPDLHGAIVVGGAWASAAVIRQLVEVGATGLITGGFIEKEIASLLPSVTDDRLALWRVTPGARAIGDEYTRGLALVATEGFGPLPMHPAAFALLQEYQGREAVVFPATRVVGQLLRPEIIIPEPDALDEDGQTTIAAYVEGAAVRLIDQAYLGQHGVIAGVPRRRQCADGPAVDIIDVELSNGKRLTVPLANLEIVA